MLRAGWPQSANPPLPLGEGPGARMRVAPPAIAESTRGA